MAKQSGLGDALFYNGYDLSNDIKAVTRAGAPSTLLDRTGIDKSAMERAFGLVSSEIGFDAYFNDAAGRAHPVLRAAATDVLVTYFRGTALGNPAASHVAHKTSFGLTRSQDGDIIQPVMTLGNGYALEWGKQMTAGSDNATGAANTTGVDFGDDIRATSAAFGLAAYLHVFAFTGTDATITIQESSNDGGGDPYANVTGGAFAEITTAPVTERIETSLTQTVEQYLRLALTTSLGFSSMDYAVMIIRYYTANRNEGAYS
jgi:hypothetical protein